MSDPAGCPRLIVSTVDYHTAGEPFRIVSGGIPPLRGRTILEKRRYALDHLDDIRQLLVFEPRGHADMYGGVFTEAEGAGAPRRRRAPPPPPPPPPALPLFPAPRGRAEFWGGFFTEPEDAGAQLGA